MPELVGMIGDDGMAAIKRASDGHMYPRLADVVDVGCNKLPYGSAPIVRTDPVAGTAVALPGGWQAVVLFVDRSAGEPCDPPPPSSTPPSNTYIYPPSVGDDDDDDKSRFCRRHWYC